MTRNIVIYKDEGAGEFGVSCLEKFFADDDVWLANAEAIIDGRVLGFADIFVMPGGADTPYCQKLNGAGNDNIRDYVEEGGTYLGLCAGAYYACSKIKWNDGANPEKNASRELALVEGTAYGILSDLIPAYIENDITSCAAPAVALADGRKATMFYHGGCAFKLPAGDETMIIARYDSVAGKPPAILASPFGEGRVILSGVHPEMSGDLLRQFPLSNEKDRERLDAMARQIGESTPSPHDLLRDILA